MNPEKIEQLKKQITEMSKQEVAAFYFGYVYSGVLRDDNNAKAFQDILDLLTIRVFGDLVDNA